MAINYNTRKSQLAMRICAWFKNNRDEDLSFGAILDKYGENGMGRKHVAKLLTNMMGGKVTVKETPLWEAWKAEVAKGRCSFSFNSKFTGNKFHGNLGKAKRTPQRFVKEKIIAKFECLDCGHVERRATEMTGTLLIGLKAVQCPSCFEFGTTAATFRLNDKTVHKAIVDGKESFVNEICQMV